MEVPPPVVLHIVAWSSSHSTVVRVYVHEDDLERNKRALGTTTKGTAALRFWASLTPLGELICGLAAEQKEPRLMDGWRKLAFPGSPCLALPHPAKVTLLTQKSAFPLRIMSECLMEW